MCLYVKQEFKTRKEARDHRNHFKIADKNIRVYKALEVYRNWVDDKFCDYISPHRGVIYKRGHKHSVPNFTFCVGRAFTIGKWGIEINRGLHAYVSEYAARQNWSDELKVKSHQICEMYIPKGAKYFLGTDGEIVSTELVFKPLSK